MKKCTKCDIEKPKADFALRNDVPSGYRAQCKACRNGQDIIRRRGLRGQLVIDRGNKCVDCGITHKNPGFYDWHHRNPKEKLYKISCLSPGSKRMQIEIVKCDLLCPNCHRIRHLKEE